MGVDSNPCTVTQPCATFAQAYTKVGSNGIVAALDPGKYGPITITGPITINGNGWAAITGTPAGNGITINAVSGDVILTGLEIDGAGAAYNGIVFNSGSSFTVTNCNLKNFISEGGFNFDTGNGILMQPTSGTLDFAITNTTASNNSGAGISYNPASGSPSAKGVIDHAIATANSIGIWFITAGTTGGATAASISNSITSNNVTGVSVENQTGSGTIKVSLDNLTVSSNTNYGVDAEGTPNVLLSRSVITNNGTGANNQTSPNTFYTYGNNQINLNGNDSGGTQDISSALNTAFTTH